MKKILGLTVAALLIMAMVAGGTWAYFSDVEYGYATITAGTLDLTIGGFSVEYDLSQGTLTNKKPGDSGNVSVELKNIGSLTGTLDILISKITNTAFAGPGEFADASGDLGANAEMALYIDKDQNAQFDGSDVGLATDNATYAPTTLQYFAINNYLGNKWTPVTMTGGVNYADNLTLVWRIGTGVGNAVQGDSVSTNITLTLNQS